MLLGHRNQIDRLIMLQERDLLGHAYLFYGTSQIGKFTIATAFACYLEKGIWPQDDVIQTLIDTQVFTPDEKNSIGIDAARAVKTFLAEKPFTSTRRVAIVDRAEMLTVEAQNALLKVAEEPPNSALLILVISDPELLWPTLQSRFQKIYFGTISEKEIEDWLKNEYQIDIAKAQSLAKLSLGKPGLARDLLEEKGVEMRDGAARFFKMPAASRKDFLKELTEPEDFSFSAFLDSLIVHLASLPTTVRQETRHSNLWHAVLELRRMQDSTNLNPRVQLMQLWTLI